jgi:alkanesulfonate monooxygenase SsuD/methylene tetrahydromethanopterin reductase-like flavin-dependent oxidoreductase (luciferase family)
LEIGLYSFGDITPDPATGRAIGVEQRYSEVIDQAKLADAGGLAVFGIGEHHRLDIPISSPAIVMAAIAAVTERIRLTSAVTVLSTLDPVRVFQDFASVDVISGGRAELIAGRGAFLESFPLFGHELSDYDALFYEKLDLLAQLNRESKPHWEGRFRPKLAGEEISPRPVQKPLPVWVGVGGNPVSAAEAAKRGLPLALANISKAPATFASQIADYRRIGGEAGFAPEALKVALSGHMFIGPDGDKARHEFYPYYSAYFANHAPKTSYLSEVPRAEYDKRAAPDGPLFVGSPEEIVAKLRYGYSLFGQQRYLAQIDIGGQPFEMVARTVELLATKVLPAVRDL